MNKKIECIKRLFDKNQSYGEVCEWFISHKLITQQEVAKYTRRDERAEFVMGILLKGEADEYFQLVDFEWSILPLEQMKITIVTEREEKVFSYGH